jgi:hypothetical protein
MDKRLPNLCMLFRNEEVFMLSFVTCCLDSLITVAGSCMQNTNEK